MVDSVVTLVSINRDHCHWNVKLAGYIVSEYTVHACILCSALLLAVLIVWDILVDIQVVHGLKSKTHVLKILKSASMSKIARHFCNKSHPGYFFKHDL